MELNNLKSIAERLFKLMPQESCNSKDAFDIELAVQSAVFITVAVNWRYTYNVEAEGSRCRNRIRAGPSVLQLPLHIQRSLQPA